MNGCVWGRLILLYIIFCETVNIFSSYSSQTTIFHITYTIYKTKFIKKSKYIQSKNKIINNESFQ